MAIKENIKLLRQHYNLSQKDLAMIAGVTDKAVSTWENGLKEPRMGVIQKIADHFGFLKSNIIEEDGLIEFLNKRTIQSTSSEILTRKIEQLPLDKKKKVEKMVDDLYSGITIAAHRTDDPTKDLPPEALASIDAFIAQMRKIYSKG